MATITFTEGSDAAPTPLFQSKQLLNNMIDGLANARPKALYAEVPISPTTYEAGYRKITYGDLANAVNAVAWWLREELGPGQRFETLSYVGPNDFRYVIILLGAVKAGYKLLLVSPRNSIPAYTSLFQATDCKVLLTSPGPNLPVVSAIGSAHRQLRILTSPSIEELFDKSHRHYPFKKTFEEARNEPLVVVHTSGTTCLPRPIIYTHDFAASVIQMNQLKSPAGFESQVRLVQGNRVFVTMPAFHAGNLYITLFDAIANQSTIIWPLSGALPSAQLLIDGLKVTQADAAILAPPFVEQIAKTPEMLDFIAKNLETVAYGGGDVSEVSGNAMSPHVKLFNFNGSTETGSFPLLRSAGCKYPSEDWKYIYPHPAAGLVFKPHLDGLYEAYIIRNPNIDDEQPVFKIFGQLSEYPTKDLFSPHPSKENLWTHRGRADDTIVLKSGYKINPIQMEQQVAHHPDVQAVLMVGTGRHMPALLIELAQPLLSALLSPTTTGDGNEQKRKEEKDGMINRIWPTIEKANSTYPVDSRIEKSHVLFTDVRNPMQRAGKGTVQRGPTLELFKDGLDNLYAEAALREGSLTV